MMLIGNTNQDIINRCIASFNNQTYPNKELIVINNAKTQLDAAAFNTKDAIIIDTPTNMTAGMARNYGFKAANGAIIAQFDPEFIWHKNRLKYQISALAKMQAHISMLSKVYAYSCLTGTIDYYANFRNAILNTMVFFRPTVDYPDINKSEELGLLERMTNVGMKVISLDNPDMACKIYGYDYPRTKVKLTGVMGQHTSMIKNWLKK